MKNILFLISFCALSTSLFAQKIVEKHMPFASHKNVVLNLQIADSIQIITWNKSEVFVKASVNVNDNKNNEDYKITFDDSGSSIEVKAKLNFDKLKNQKKNNCCNTETEIYYQVYIPENVNFSIETINGNIIIAGKTSEIKVNTISGFVDLTLANDTKADFKLKTISGTIYSNLAMNGITNKKSSITNISDQLNGGGKSIDLQTISGDIFLRKTK